MTVSLGPVNKLLEGDVAVCDKVVRRDGSIMEDGQGQVLCIRDSLSDRFIPGRSEGLVLCRRPIEMVIIDIDRDVWIECLGNGCMSSGVLGWSQVNGFNEFELQDPRK